jgi:aminomethyltransferase
MKQTSLYQEHLNLKGKIVDFADWELPVLYTSIIDEHAATRTHVSIFDVSHMGEITVKGKDAEKFLRKLIPTSLERLENNRCMYSCFCNEYGGVIDDLFVYQLSQQEYLLVVNAATIEKDLRWMKLHVSGDVEIENLSDTISKIDIQGPYAKQVLAESIPDEKIEDLERFQFMYSMFDSKPVMISYSGYTGESGYEVYLHNDSAPLLWRTFLEKGKNYGLLPAGLGSRDTLRLEACYSLYGHELNDSISPIEAGIGWIVNSKDEYIGKNVLDQQKKSGAPRKLVSLEMIDRGVPREHCTVTKNGKEIGVTTSGGFSPTFKKGIALALVQNDSVAIDDTVEIVVRDKGLKARVVKRPFYKYCGA